LIYIPNVFSPNGDGINDEWVITAEPVSIPMLSGVKIFDRWGSLLYATGGIECTGADALWNGLGKEGVVNPGVFTYQLELLRPDGSTVVKSGTVTVLH
jgi:gliding motility-associated-like protein